MPLETGQLIFIPHNRASCDVTKQYPVAAWGCHYW